MELSVHFPNPVQVSNLHNYLYSCKCNKKMVITHQLLQRNIPVKQIVRPLRMLTNCGAGTTDRMFRKKVKDR
jgi:hypothetical protein